MGKLRNLILDHFCNGWMGMSKCDSGNSGNEINVSITLVIVKILVVSFSDVEWLFIVMEIKVRHVGSSVFSDLLISLPIVRLWLVVHFWEA